jgi:hypothetical protein
VQKAKSLLKPFKMAREIDIGPSELGRSLLQKSKVIVNKRLLASISLLSLGFTPRGTTNSPDLQLSRGLSSDETSPILNELFDFIARPLKIPTFDRCLDPSSGLP